MKPLVVKKTQNTGWENCPEGSFTAKIIGMTDPKPYTTKFNGEERTVDKLRVVFEINQKNKSGNRFTVFSTPMTVSLNEKSNLFKFIKSVGVDLNRLTITGSQDCDVRKLVGSFCNIVVEHNNVEGRTYANVVSTTKPLKNHETWDLTIADVAPSKPISLKEDNGDEEIKKAFEAVFPDAKK